MCFCFQFQSKAWQKSHKFCRKARLQRVMFWIPILLVKDWTKIIPMSGLHFVSALKLCGRKMKTCSRKANLICSAEFQKIHLFMKRRKSCVGRNYLRKEVIASLHLCYINTFLLCFFIFFFLKIYPFYNVHSQKTQT